MLRPFLIIGFMSGTGAAFAGPVQLTGEDLNKTLRGALIEMDTPLGTKIPVRFGTDGLVSGEAGELAPLLGSARDRGRWWIDGDRVCSKWFRWFDAEPQCISVRQDGTRLFWREDGGKTGTATLVEGPPAEKPAPPKTVVAEADAAPRSQPAAKAGPAASAPKAVQVQPTPPVVAKAAIEPLPLPIRGPARVAEAPVAEADDPSEDVAAVETLSVAQTASAPGGRTDIPMMRFGGAGLLEASARIARVEAVEATEEIRAPSASADTKDSQTEMRVATLAPAPKAPPAPESKARRIETAMPSKQASSADVRDARDPWTSAPSIRAPGFYRVRGVARRDTLNVRRGPSESHAAVATIPPNGRRIEITGACQGEWCPIRYRRATGWVHSFYLAEEMPGRGSASRVYLAQP